MAIAILLTIASYYSRVAGIVLFLGALVCVYNDDSREDPLSWLLILVMAVGWPIFAVYPGIFIFLIFLDGVERDIRRTFGV